MSSDAQVPVGRSYTRARRHPWVIGKIQGWTIPLGPFTPTQLGVLVGGLFLVVQTHGLWRPLGAFGLVFVALPFAATWAVRHARIDGRTPVRALAGYLVLLAEPACGRIGGRLARDPRPERLSGSFRLTALPDLAGAAAPVPAAPVSEAPSPPEPASGRLAAGTALPTPTRAQQMLARNPGGR